ncbi:MAG: NAD-dependent epimerase/dehydratase family protein [Acidimicrobiales bacterium]
MKILFTGATGVVGRAAIPHLIAAGHIVDGLARSDEGRSWLTEVGARPAELDLFDEQAVDEAVAGADAVLHFATAIPPMGSMAKPSAWAMNDRLRSDAVRVLVDAAVRHGVDVFVQESISFTYADGGDEWLGEDATIDPASPMVRSALDAERHVDRFTAAGGRGVSLRIGHLYGPGRASAEYMEAVSARRLPVIGTGTNYVSSIHVHDAGTAVAAALSAPAGVYNVSDDQPVRAHEVVESLAAALGARRPRRIPRLMAKPVLRSVLPVMTVSQRVSAERFKTATGWTPRYPSVVDGWVDVTSTASPRPEAV